MEKHEINRNFTRKISYVGLAIIAVNYIIVIANYDVYRRVTGEYSPTLDTLTYIIMPQVFLLIDCTLMFIALIWICKSLRNDP